MNLKPEKVWFLAFTALFAVLAGLVFWGTWSCHVTPVMPDCATVHPNGYWAALSQYAASCFREWQVIPDDLLLFVGTPYFRQELQYAFALFFAALGVVYYARGRGMAPLAAYGAALLLAFSGYWCTLFSAGHYGWFRWMTYGVFAFGLCDRAVRKEKLRHWIMLAAVLAWPAKYQQDLWLVFTIFTALYFVWCCVRERKMPHWRGIAVAIAAFLLIGGANIRSAFTSALAARQGDIAREQDSGSSLVGGAGKSDDEAKWIFTTNWSMPPEDALEFFIPRIHGDTSCPLSLSLALQRKLDLTPYTGRLGRPIDATQGNYRQHSLYVGLVTCLFAIAAVVLAITSRARGARSASGATGTTRRSDLWFFFGAAIVFALLSMGRYVEPLYRLVFHLPLIGYLRAPVKWHHVTEFAIVMLAAHGIDMLWRIPVVQSRRALRVALIALVAAGAFDLARSAARYCVGVPLDEVRRQNAEMSLTVLGAQQLSNPQVANLVKARRIIPLAPWLGSRDAYLIEYLVPRKPPAPEQSATPLAATLGLVSILSSCAAIAFVLREVKDRR